MKRLVMLLMISEVMSELPPMPQISSGGCGNSKAILFVRQIRYVNVLKDYIQKKGAEIKDAAFVIKIAQIKIKGLQSIIESMKIVINSYAAKIESTKEGVKELQGQYPDVNKLSGVAFCEARYALAMIPPLKFALKNGYMDFDNSFVYTNVAMQMGSCLKDTTVSLDEMVSSSIQTGVITDKQLEAMMGASRADFPSLYGESFDQYAKSFNQPFDKGGVQDNLIQFTRAISGLKPFLDQLSKTIAGIKVRIKNALNLMQKYSTSMATEYQNVLDNQNLVKNHIATIQAQKKIIEDCATEIINAKDTIQDLVVKINNAQSDNGMFKDCPKWLQTALKGI